jgi:hypothetical protein
VPQKLREGNGAPHTTLLSRHHLVCRHTATQTGAFNT